MSAHTPGPWIFDPDEYGCRLIFSEASPEFARRDICSTVGLAADDEDEANANLIISAPELLAALKRLTAEIKGAWSLREPSIREVVGNTNYVCVAQAIADARAAIARATGTAAEAKTQDEREKHK